MPANLPPHYHEAEKRYRSARTIPEKVAALQEMLALMPKHKGTDHLKADLRARVAKLMDDLEHPAASKGGRPYPFAIRKEGAGQAVLIGPPNSGKSSLLAALTGAKARIGEYPFTTQLPEPGEDTQPDAEQTDKRLVIAAAKADLGGALDKSQGSLAEYGERFPVV